LSRAQYAPDLDEELIPPWMFLPSTQNITVESGWRTLFYTWGVNILEFFEPGRLNGFFQPGNYIHEYNFICAATDTLLMCPSRQLSNWIWFPAIQRSLDEFCHQQNNHRIRKQQGKILPSGGTPNEFYSKPEEWGGEDCLIRVPAEVIDELLADCEEGYKQMRYVEEDFDVLAQAVYEAVDKPEITVQNAWEVFRTMIGQFGNV
jgi:hypothetical protein